MRQIELTVCVPEAKLIEMAKHNLGLVEPGTLVDPTALQAVIRKRSEAVDAAIEHVLRATRKFEEAQYSNGFASAATALFEAGKRLRKASAEEKKTRNLKGIFNV